MTATKPSLKDGGERHSPPWDGKFCATPTAVAIGNLCTFCQTRGEMGLVVGDPGVGKTSAFNRYERQNSLVGLATMNVASEPLAGALNQIAVALDAYAERRAIRMLWEAIVYKLTRHGSTMQLIILDEAQHMSDRALEAVRQIHDETKVGVVLGGNASFPTRFNGRRGAAIFAQFTSRVGMRLTLAAPTPEDVEALCSHYGIRDARSKDFLAKVVDAGGNLRNVAKIARLAWEIDDALTFDAIRKAANMMGAKP